MIGTYLRWGVALCATILLAQACLLFTTDVFGYHDSTQAGRVYDFVLNLKHGHVPPRIAPTFSYEMGYPIFNHYAPTAYWVTSIIHFAGASIPYALKLSFFFSVIVGAGSMYLFARRYYSEQGALLSAVLYGSSPFMAVEIFVRGNLAELWFLALLPLTLYLLHKVYETNQHSWVVALAVTFALLLMSHNALSIVGGVLVVAYACTIGAKRILFALTSGFGLAVSFLIPAVFELAQTHAAEIATQTQYREHFTCVRQLWDSPWGFGGSMPGCVDGMSFQLGKAVLLLGGGGLIVWMISSIRTWTKTHTLIQKKLGLLCLATVISLFLAIDVSQSVWTVGEPILKLFQFPWRFLSISLFGLAFFAGKVLDSIPRKGYADIVLIACALIVFYMNMPFFQPNPDKKWTYLDFTQQFLSHDYLRNDIAYRVPEYIPQSVSLQKWMDLRDDPLKPTTQKIITHDGELFSIVSETPFGFEIATSSQDFTVSKHMSEHLDIHINGASVLPDEVDELGRPHIQTDAAKSLIKVSYKQTSLEKISNMITLIAGMVLLLPYIRLWKRTS